MVHHMGFVAHALLAKRIESRKKLRERGLLSEEGEWHEVKTSKREAYCSSVLLVHYL